ncbi:DNA-binding protein creA [Erysiphe neolycopersici]|uniref:DNA-binding protein creA n=1 Tax=Erysiphe neolycopersici TaxID=212602 RepID=A0A420HMG4_9PEZI|nr:DNA-binding protein creA [Erysiphe neolycopersici]
MNRLDLLPSMIEAASRNLAQRQDLPRPYKCPLCEKSFHRLEHQTRHIRTHTGEKPHRCSHPGCVKRFSRSDELTRHLRIHSNPNSRRSGRVQQQSLVNGSASKGRDRNMPSMVVTMPPPPPNKIISRSAPVSTIASPNLSPTASYSSYVRGPSDSDDNNNNNTLSENSFSGQSRQFNDASIRNGVFNLDMNLLASAATQVERDNLLSEYQTPRYNQSCCDLSAYKSRNHLPLPSPFKSRQPPPTLDKVNNHCCIKRYMKRSRTDSPNSTAPSSPTFYHDSLSPTPDDTPLVTPAHSPRLRSHGSGYDLPSLRNLSLYQQHLPTLPPMEPNTIEFLCNPSPLNSLSYGPATITKTTGSSLSEIILQTDGTQRKLPCPLFSKVSYQDYHLSNENGF